MENTKNQKQRISIGFETIKENCKTIGDLQKLDKDWRQNNEY